MLQGKERRGLNGKVISETESYFESKDKQFCIGHRNIRGALGMYNLKENVAMFPPNLQKNIWELDRQISLLETECEDMESKKKETTPTGKTSPKTARALPNKPFITGPCASASSYSHKMVVLPPPAPKIYSASCAHFRTLSEKTKFPTESQHNRSNGFEDSNHSENITKFTDAPSEGPRRISPITENNHRKNLTFEETNHSREEEPKTPCDRETKPCNRQRPISSIKEVSESSDENVTIIKGAIANNSETWNISNGKPPDKKNPLTEVLSLSKPKLSSDEDGIKNTISNEKWIYNERSVTPRQKITIQRRPRSARTKKNYADEIPLDLNISKTWHEKEIQCMLWNEEAEKAEFLDNLNDSIRTLHLLINELKMKSSRDRRDDVLNDMQNTLTKISKIKSMNTVHNPLIMLDTLQRKDVKLLEGEENILDLKKTLLGVKQFCQELNDEKTALTEEVSAKNRALVTFKNKEKEYLSLISSLKYNLEKMKEEAEEGARAKRDLNIMKNKLQEESKVIEALKKSHEKMQELIENYVLENDKLKAQVKINMLETQKFSVLLAGKEVEISTYKKEIESFQRQITEQLSLLRSKATESEVEYALEAINNQTNIFESVKINNSRTTIGMGDFNENEGLESTETTSESSSAKTQSNNQSKEPEKPAAGRSRKEAATESKMVSTSCETEKPQRRAEAKNDSDSDDDSGRQHGLQRVLSSSKNLRSSINELLEDMRRETTEKHWPDVANSCRSSSQTTLTFLTSDDASEGS